MATTPEFKYAPMFQLGKDDTEYYLLTKDYVSVGEFEGKPMLKIAPEGLTAMANAAFRDGDLQPVLAGAVPDSIYPMISRAAAENDAMLDAAFSLDLNFAREKFCTLNLLKRLTREEKEALFDEMCAGTAKYLTAYRK